MPKSPYRPSQAVWILTAAGLVLFAALLCVSCSPPATRSTTTPSPAAAPRVVVDVRTEHRTLTSSEAVEYAGNESCAPCHSALVAQHARTRHANTLRPVTVAEHGDEFRQQEIMTDRLIHVTYSPKIEDGKCVMKGNGEDGGGSLSADYAMGAGKNGHAFFHLFEPNIWMDLRISYYTQTKRWGFAPMQFPEQHPRNAQGRMHTGAGLSKCLLCHVTVLRQDMGQMNIKDSLLGVGCERCHGSGKRHIEVAMRTGVTPQEARSSIDGLHQSSPEAINQLCGSCHRTTDNAPAGDAHTENDLARFQGAALARSKCYIQSKTLSCISCHASHTDAITSTSRYNAICLQCHSAPGAALPVVVGEHTDFPPTARGRICPVNPRTGCTDCHMPRQNITKLMHATFANHWIKVWKRKTK